MPYYRVEKKLQAGMIEGHMHGCLRDSGRLAGGLLAGGQITLTDVANLTDLAVSLSLDKQLGKRTFEEGVQFGRNQPLKKEYRDPEYPEIVLDWDSPIKQGGKGADYIEHLPAPRDNRIQELIDYLQAVYRPGDVISYVLQSSLKGGKYRPAGKGVFTRTQSEIVEDLRRYSRNGDVDAAIASALGSWDAEAGGWIRLNPMSGSGVTNNDVVNLRHVLVECDEIELEVQLATIHATRLPCSAIVHSGKKSIHAVVRIDAGSDRALYRMRVERLFKYLEEAGFPVDQQCKNPSRLSRMPGLTRAGKRQYLVSGPTGCKDWSDWEAQQDADQYRADILSPERITAKLPDDNLVGQRFLTRGGSWLLVAQSGVGKSVFCLQGAMSFACGRDVFGLQPSGPLKQLVIQAENNPLDVQETWLGVQAGLRFTDAEQAQISANVRVTHVDRYAGDAFAGFLDWICTRERPDIVWIDPLLAYIGGEISKMADCSRFLRNQINPVVHDHNIGVIMMHHTGKPPKKSDDNYSGADLAYLGIGSSDLTNWARATSTILRIEDHENRFVLQHTKRGKRAGCDYATDLSHAHDGIYWRLASGERAQPKKEFKKERKTGYQGIYAGCGFEQMPPLRHDLKDRENSELLPFLEDKLIEFSVPTQASLETVRSTLAKAGLIVFDRENKTWKGKDYSDEIIEF